MALTTLAKVKEYAGISDSTWDALLTTLLDAASAAIENWCDRAFASATYTQYYDGLDSWRGGYLSLRHTPVTAITRVATRPLTVLTVRNSATSTNQRATVQVTNAGLTLTRIASGVTTTDTLAFATYTTLSALKEAIDAIGSGWAATVAGDGNDYGKWPTADLKVIQGALNARSDSGGAELVLYADELPDYRLDAESGTLWGRFPQGYQNIEVRYTAGYTTIPDPVQTACCAAVKAIFDATKNDEGMKAEKLGDYAFTRADGTFDLGAPVFGVARALLRPYKRIEAL